MILFVAHHNILYQLERSGYPLAAKCRTVEGKPETVDALELPGDTAAHDRRGERAGTGAITARVNPTLARSLLAPAVQSL